MKTVSLKFWVRTSSNFFFNLVVRNLVQNLKFSLACAATVEHSNIHGSIVYSSHNSCCYYYYLLSMSKNDPVTVCGTLLHSVLAHTGWYTWRFFLNSLSLGVRIGTSMYVEVCESVCSWTLLCTVTQKISLKVFRRYADGDLVQIFMQLRSVCMFTTGSHACSYPHKYTSDKNLANMVRNNKHLMRVVYGCF